MKILASAYTIKLSQPKHTQKDLDLAKLDVALNKRKTVSISYTMFNSRKEPIVALYRDFTFEYLPRKNYLVVYFTKVTAGKAPRKLKSTFNMNNHVKIIDPNHKE